MSCICSGIAVVDTCVLLAQTNPIVPAWTRRKEASYECTEWLDTPIPSHPAPHIQPHPHPRARARTHPAPRPHPYMRTYPAARTQANTCIQTRHSSCGHANTCESAAARCSSALLFCYFMLSLFRSRWDVSRWLVSWAAALWR